VGIGQIIILLSEPLRKRRGHPNLESARTSPCFDFRLYRKGPCRLCGKPPIHEVCTSHRPPVVNPGPYERLRFARDGRKIDVSAALKDVRTVHDIRVGLAEQPAFQLFPVATRQFQNSRRLLPRLVEGVRSIHGPEVILHPRPAIRERITSLPADEYRCPPDLR
jgi:hypothetical protein